MRVALYHPRAVRGDGGITNSVRLLAAAMARAGARPIIVCDADVSPLCDANGVEWRPVGHRRVGRVRVPVRLDEAIDGSDILIMNSAWTAHNVLAGRAARRVQVPYVLAPRGAYDPRILGRRPILKRLWWMTWERELTARASAIHVFFQSQEAHLRRLGYRGQVLVAPNGVTAPDNVRWAPHADRYLLYLGRFDPEHKGLDLLVRAIARTPRSSLPPCRLHGPDWCGGKGRLERLISSLGLEDRIQVRNPVHGDAKWATIAGATGFVYPSRWEGFGNSVAEAAAIGVPILATPYPLGAFLAEREAAVLTPATVEGVRHGLLRLVGATAPEIGRRAREVVNQHFTWDEVARSWLRQLPNTRAARTPLSVPDHPTHELQ